MAAVTGIELRERTGLLGSGLDVPNQPSLLLTTGYVKWWKRSLSRGGRPVQISDWLIDAYPSNEEMWVSHETIYQSLFIQG